MSDAFDPYYIWLGIPPEEQPPHHYRLLGVTLFEENSEVIEAAANRQMAYIQEISAGDDHIDQAQKIMGQLSQARICLLNDEKKVAYDAELRDSFDALTAAAAPEPPATTPVADDPLMPPTFGLPDDELGVDEAGESVGPPAVGLPQQPHAAKAKKQSSLGLIIGLAVLALVLIGGIFFYFIGEAKKQDQQRLAQREKDAQAEREAKEEDENTAKENDLRVKEAEQRAKDAEQKLKHAAEQKAQAEAKRKAKEAAKRKAAEVAKRKAAEVAKRKAEEVAKRKAAEEAKNLAAAKKEAEEEEAKQKAEEEARRKAQELRDNPDKLLESKGFKKKGTKWVFAQEEKLKLVTSDLTKEWRTWKKLIPQNEAALKAKLEIYNKLLLASFENDAMRQAVSEDLTSVLEDPDVAAALDELKVKKTELSKTARLLKTPDSKLKNAIYEKPIFPGKPGHRYAALIINEKESAVVHLDPEAMGEKDAPSLFILPRAKWTAAGGTRGQPKEIWMNRTWPTYILETSGATIRCGLFRVSNPTVHLMPTHGEGGVPNGETNFGGKAGSNGWKKFFTQMKPHKIEHNVGAITAARKKLDAYQLKKKK